MFSRVKKFRDKIFSSSNNSSRKGDSSEPDESPATTSRTASYSAAQLPASMSPTALSIAPHSPSRDFFKSKQHSSTTQRQQDEAQAQQIGVEQMVLRGASSSASRRSSNLGEPMLSSKDALPAVQVNSAMMSIFNKGPYGGAALPPPPGVSNAQILSPSGSGRRKSTPAALDFALRTAEGKHAVEELLNHHNKKLVFGQYFAGNAPAAAAQVPLSPNSQAVAKAAAVSRFQHKPTHLSTSTSTRSQGDRHEQLAGTSSTHLRHHDEAAAPRSPAPSAPRSGLSAPVSAASSQPKPQPPNSTENYKSPAKLSYPTETLAETLPFGASIMNAPGSSAHATAPAAGAAGESPAAGSSSSNSRGGAAAMVPPPRPGKQTKVIVVSATLPATMNRKVWQLSDYNIVRKMYTGYASTVYQALCKRSLEMVALKVYHLENLCELNHYQVYREIRVHAALQHQNIIHLYCAFQESSDVVLVQEYAEGGDLYRLLHKNGGRLHERQTVEMVLHPFLLALHYLHTNGIMHRDIKPENVLFTEQRVLKLADFGLAIDLNEERAVTRAGTLDYMAPEVLRCPPKNLPQENKNNPYLHYNNSVDAWAVGVFAYELVVGFPPFAGETQLDSVDKIMHSTPDFPEKITELAKDFICQALRKHPGDRPTVMEMLHHPWVRTYQRRTSVRMDVRRRSSVNNTVASMQGMQEGAAEGEDDSGAPSNAPRAVPHAAPQHSQHPWPTSNQAQQQAAAQLQQQQQQQQQQSHGQPSSQEYNDDAHVEIADMTPEQIENMIRKLQVAKVSAMARGNVHRSQ